MPLTTGRGRQATNISRHLSIGCPRIGCKQRQDQTQMAPLQAPDLIQKVTDSVHRQGRADPFTHPNGECEAHHQAKIVNLQVSLAYHHLSRREDHHHRSGRRREPLFGGSYRRQFRGPQPGAATAQGLCRAQGQDGWKPRRVACLGPDDEGALTHLAACPSGNQVAGGVSETQEFKDACQISRRR